jgi:hypothetical protein
LRTETAPILEQFTPGGIDVRNAGQINDQASLAEYGGSGLPCLLQITRAAVGQITSQLETKRRGPIVHVVDEAGFLSTMRVIHARIGSDGAIDWPVVCAPLEFVLQLVSTNFAAKAPVD